MHAIVRMRMTYAWTSVDLDTYNLHEHFGVLELSATPSTSIKVDRQSLAPPYLSHMCGTSTYTPPPFRAADSLVCTNRWCTRISCAIYNKKLRRAFGVCDRVVSSPHDCSFLCISHRQHVYSKNRYTAYTKIIAALDRANSGWWGIYADPPHVTQVRCYKIVSINGGIGANTITFTNTVFLTVFDGLCCRALTVFDGFLLTVFDSRLGVIATGKGSSSYHLTYAYRTCMYLRGHGYLRVLVNEPESKYCACMYFQVWMRFQTVDRTCLPA
jgi:hypothetical protein